MSETAVAVVPKYESRWALPFVGYMGWFFYVWELFVIIAVMCTLIDAWNNAPGLFLGVVVTNIGVAFILLMVNGFYFMPYYATRLTKKFEVSNEPAMLPEMIMVREERSYAGKVREDLKAHNDQEHFQGVIFRNIIILIFLAVIVGTRGTQSFQPIPAVFINNDIMNYVVIKCFQLLILASAAWSFSRLAETHSNFMWRHMTAENVQYREKNGDNKALGSYSGTVTRRAGASLRTPH